MSAWKAGKVLWFDPMAGEGVVIDDDGNSYYVHQAAIQTSKQKKGSKTDPSLKDNSRVRFTVYQNSYRAQVDCIKEDA